MGSPSLICQGTQQQQQQERSSATGDNKETEKEAKCDRDCDCDCDVHNVGLEQVIVNKDHINMNSNMIPVINEIREKMECFEVHLKEVLSSVSKSENQTLVEKFTYISTQIEHLLEPLSSLPTSSTRKMQSSCSCCLCKCRSLYEKRDKELQKRETQITQKQIKLKRKREELKTMAKTLQNKLEAVIKKEEEIEVTLSRILSSSLSSGSILLPELSEEPQADNKINIQKVTEENEKSEHRKERLNEITGDITSRKEEKGVYHSSFSTTPLQNNCSLLHPHDVIGYDGRPFEKSPASKSAYTSILTMSEENEDDFFVLGSIPKYDTTETPILELNDNDIDDDYRYPISLSPSQSVSSSRNSESFFYYSDEFQTSTTNTLMHPQQTLPRTHLGNEMVINHAHDITVNHHQQHYSSTTQNILPPPLPPSVSPSPQPEARTKILQLDPPFDLNIVHNNSNSNIRNINNRVSGGNLSNSSATIETEAPESYDSY